MNSKSKTPFPPWKQLERDNLVTEFSMSLLSPELTSAHIVKLTQRLLDSIVSNDWALYCTLIDPSLTCFEPEGNGTLIEGTGFHKFFFDHNGPVRSSSVRVSMHNPRVRLVGHCAIIAYNRIVQRKEENGEIRISKMEETRVWEKKGTEWKQVHFHKSKL